MTGEALYRCSVTALSAHLREGKCSSRGLLDHYLERIDALNPDLNALVFIDSGAVAAAEQSDAQLRLGRPRSPLEGIPVAIKDNLLMRGCPASWGSRLFADYVPEHDELPVARLRALGAVLIGKTNVPEFALRGSTDNSVYGLTRNPWNLSLTPGGSSGGAVAAVAAGLVPLALATDGGGSIRRPAAHTGLVGLKPSVGRIRRGRGFPPLMFDFEVVGPIARTAGDARTMFCALAQSGQDDRQRSKNARILFVERFGDAPIEPEIVERSREAAERLKALGHDVVHGPLPFSIEAATAAWQALPNVGLAYLAQINPRFFECAAPDFIEQAQVGGQMSAVEYARLIETVFAFRSIVAKAFYEIDIIMTPATAAQPWSTDQAYPETIAGRNVGARGHAVFTPWVNACGHPAVAIPASPDEQGMPIGFQLVGAMFADEFLLDIAEEYERAHPFANRWPAMIG